MPYLRIGRLWEEQLRDTRTASEYYRHVLKVAPKHRAVRFRLARLAKADGDLEQAHRCADILTSQVPADDSERDDAILANTELANIALELDGHEQQAIDLAQAFLRWPRHQRHARGHRPPLVESPALAAVGGDSKIAA